MGFEEVFRWELLKCVDTVGGTVSVFARLVVRDVGALKGFRGVGVTIGRDMGMGQINQSERLVRDIPWQVGWNF